MFDSGLPACHRGTRSRSPRCRCGCISLRMASVRVDSGTRCSLPAFMRSAGTIQILSSQVDLGPPRADHLSGPGGGQDGKFERPGRDAFLLAQARPGSPATRRRAAPRDVRPSAPWIVPATACRGGHASGPGSRPRDSRAPLPSRGSTRCARARRPAVSGFVVQIGSSTLSTSAVSIGLHREIADNGLGIGGERRFPLRRMLGIAPAGPVAGDVACRRTP